MADEWREQVSFLRSINGTAAHILLALLVAGRELAVEDLAVATGYEKRTLSKALALLEALGMAGVVAPQGDGWALLAAAQERLMKLPEEGTGSPENVARAARVPSSSSSIKVSSFVDEGKKKKSADGAQQAIFDLLRRAGVGSRSPKMLELMSAGLDVEYVRGHVLAREALLERGDDYPVGWLIHKLECGDAAPAIPKERGYIPQEYADVVMR